MITLSPRQITRFLLFIVLGLVLASLAGQFSKYYLNHATLLGLIPRFNVDAENNIPTWYSSFALLFCSALLAIIASAKRLKGDRFTRHWIALSVIFLYLSLDEVASIHELLIEPLRSLLDASGFLYFTWVIPGAIFVVICLLLFLQFLRSLPAKTRRLFLLAGTIFVTGALGVELVGGYYAESSSQNNMTYAMITTIEESLEMVGIVVFIYALLSYMSSVVSEVKISISDQERASKQSKTCTAKRL